MKIEAVFASTNANMWIRLYDIDTAAGAGAGNLINQTYVAAATGTVKIAENLLVKTGLVYQMSGNPDHDGGGNLTGEHGINIIYQDSQAFNS